MTAQRDELNAVSDNADQRATAVSDQRAIPDATVARLAIYLRALTGLGERGTATVSSEELATEAGVNSAKLRKDLSYLGSYGVRGVGYDVASLTEHIQMTLGLNRNRAVALIGIGHLGQALVGYAGFASRGFRISAVIDADPALVGTRLRGLTVQHVNNLNEVVRSEKIAIAVLAVPASSAQDVCDRLVAAGVTSILNFAPTVLNVPAHVDVRKVDLAAELQILSFHDNRKAARAGCAPLAEVAPATVAVSVR
jgi:redox-sensing transcriptional repressor